MARRRAEDRGEAAHDLAPEAPRIDVEVADHLRAHFGSARWAQPYPRDAAVAVVRHVEHTFELDARIDGDVLIERECGSELAGLTLDPTPRAGVQLDREALTLTASNLALPASDAAANPQVTARRLALLAAERHEGPVDPVADQVCGNIGDQHVHLGTEGAADVALGARSAVLCGRGVDISRGRSDIAPGHLVLSGLILFGAPPEHGEQYGERGLPPRHDEPSLPAPGSRTHLASIRARGSAVSAKSGSAYPIVARARTIPGPDRLIATSSALSMGSKSAKRKPRRPTLSRRSFGL